MINQISVLKREITEVIRATPLEQLPKEFIFQENWTDPQYKITIEAMTSDIYIDSTGQKWVKVKE